MILAMGIFYGGLAQVIAGIIEAKKNNTFGLTAFTSYGLFLVIVSGLDRNTCHGLGTETIRSWHERLFRHVGFVLPS